MGWVVSDVKDAEVVGMIELSNNRLFEVLNTKERLVFGSMANIGFIESGYMLKDNHFTLDENVQELIDDLEVYYRDGSHYVSDIVCNQRM
jgi:hypothetical protein